MWIIDLCRTAMFRLALLFAIAVTAATSLVLAFVYWQVIQRDTTHMRNILAAEAAQVSDLPAQQLTQQLDLRLTTDLRRLDYAALFDADGRHVSGNMARVPPDLEVDGAAHSVELPARVYSDGRPEPALIVAARRKDGGVLLLGRDLYQVYAFRRVVFNALMLGLAPAVVLALVIGAIFSVRASRRLKAINQQITRIMQGDLDERLPEQGTRDDLDLVTKSVNHMLDEIVRLLGQIRSVGANIAHDLRTPLAVMRARLERGLEAERESDLRASAEKALVELDHAMATVTALLRISELEYGRRTSSFREVDLKEVCVSVFELYQPLAEAKSIAFTLDAAGPLPVRGDFDLLVEAAANLVDNAIKFTPAGGVVKIAGRMTPAGPLVGVSDSGPGVAPVDRQNIFRRFYRSDKNSSVPGTGLGLSMAAAIAQLHGFDLRVADNHPGSRFEMFSRQAP